MENSKSILISLLHYQFIDNRVMFLMNVIIYDIIHGSTCIIKPKDVSDKTFVNLVTGNSLIGVVALLDGLHRATSRLPQLMPISEAVLFQ